MSQYQRETLSQCQAEIQPVLRNEHWEEVGHYRDQPIDMQWDKYAQLEQMGKLRCYTVRAFINQEFKETILQGYAFYLVDFHLHYKTVKVAGQDILYMRKQFRGSGRKFIDWCDEQLKAEGVTTVTQHIKPHFDWGPMAESLGYELAEKIYTRRLD